MLVSILIPCYNEKKTIEQIINKIVNLKIQKEIIIIDDGSNDGTTEILKKILKKKKVKVLFKKKNEGKGSAIILGLKKCKGELIAIQDADLEYNPKDLIKIFKKFEDKSIKAVYGSRVLGKKRFSLKKKLITNFRVFANLILTLISNIINSQKLTDAHTCYKIFRSNLLKKIKLKEKGFAFCPELTTKFSNNNIEIIEVPISYKGREIKDGKKIRFTDALEAIFVIIKYKFILR